jgi:hypothetical protein
MPVDVVDARVDDDGVLVVELRWTGAADRQAAIPTAFALLGSFAEEMTYIRMDETPGEIVLETVTGVVSQGQFAPHGHMVRLRVVGS